MVMREKNEIEVSEPNSLTRIVDKENGITISQFEGEINPEDDSLIPVPDNLASYVSVALQGVPGLATNAINYSTLNNTLYTVSFNGRNVLPEELYTKGNGHLISNLKGDGSHWGKQTDIDSFNTDFAKNVTVASSVFAVAAVATSMYYMKNINDKLAGLEETTRSILEFLENDKQSQVEADLELLREIADNMDAIKENEDLMQIKLTQFAAVQRDTKKNIRFYRKQINSALRLYTSQNKKKKQHHSFNKLRSEYEYYRFCLVEYAISKLIEIQLTEGYSAEELNTARDELKELNEKHQELNKHLRSKIRDYHFGKIQAKALKGLSSSLDFLGNVVYDTPLGKTELDETLISLGHKSGTVTRKKANRVTNKVLTEEDNSLVDPVIHSINMIKATYNNKLEYIQSEDGAFLKVAAGI